MLLNLTIADSQGDTVREAPKGDYPGDPVDHAADHGIGDLPASAERAHLLRPAGIRGQGSHRSGHLGGLRPLPHCQFRAGEAAVVHDQDTQGGRGGLLQDGGQLGVEDCFTHFYPYRWPPSLSQNGKCI